MKPWRHPAFVRLYAHLPHPLIDRALARAMRLTRPRWAIQSLIAAWVHRGHIDLDDFEPGPFATVEAFFLRRLAPGRRPLLPATPGAPVSPVDGTVVLAHPLGRPERFEVKGVHLSLGELLGEREPRDAGFAAHDARAEPGHVVGIFLSPDGYHRVHAPLAGVIRAIVPIPGMSLPQNDDALGVHPDVYLRNARVVLVSDDWTLVMVAASLVSQVVVRVGVGERVAAGDELGHFTFGSTVVVVFRAPIPPLAVQAGDAVRMGGPLTR